MSIEEALKILELNRDFTEDSLKKAYRSKSKIYHTDRHSKEFDKIEFYTRMQQDINIAYDILKKYLSQRDNVNNTSSDYDKDIYENMYYRDMELLERLKVKYKEELKNEIDDISKIDSKDKLFSKWKDSFLDKIYELYKCIDSQPNSISLKINYDVYKKEYFELICWYLYDHWNNSKIIEFAGNLGIDKNDGIKIVRTKMIMAITSILNLEIETFKSIDNYNEVESLLLNVRDGIVSVCLFGYINIDKAKKDLKDKIVLEINKYNKRKELLDELIKYYGYPTPLVVELYNNILNEDNFYALYNDKIDFRTKFKVRVKNMFSK